MGLLRKNLARKSAKANARVAALELESAELQLQRSQAETVLAQCEADRLRADLQALQVRYAELEHRADTPPAQRSAGVSSPTRT